MGVDLALVRSHIKWVGCKGGRAARVGGLPRLLIARITWVGCTACVLVCMLFRFSQEVLISTLVIVPYKTILKKVLQVKLNVFK